MIKILYATILVILIFFIAIAGITIVGMLPLSVFSDEIRYSIKKLSDKITE